MLCFRVTCPFPIRFNRLAVHFNNQNYDSLCVINGPGSDNLEVPEKGDLYLEPRKIKHIMFTFIPLPEDVGKQIEVLIYNETYSIFYTIK